MCAVTDVYCFDTFVNYKCIQLWFSFVKYIIYICLLIIFKYERSNKAYNG